MLPSYTTRRANGIGRDSQAGGFRLRTPDVSFRVRRLATNPLRFRLRAAAARPGLRLTPDAAAFPVATSQPGNYLSATIASADRDTAAASLYYREALRADPQNLDLVERAFAAALAAGDARGAYALADRLAARDPANALARLALAVRAFSNGQYPAARAQIAAGDAAHGRDVTSALLTAWAYAGAGDLRHALEALDKVSDPNVAVFRDYHAALIAQVLGDPAEALSATSWPTPRTPARCASSTLTRASSPGARTSPAPESFTPISPYAAPTIRWRRPRSPTSIPGAR